jgi:hypothetical protein
MVWSADAERDYSPRTRRAPPARMPVVGLSIFFAMVQFGPQHGRSGPSADLVNNAAWSRSTSSFKQTSGSGPERLRPERIPSCVGRFQIQGEMTRQRISTRPLPSRDQPATSSLLLPSPASPHTKIKSTGTFTGSLCVPSVSRVAIQIAIHAIQLQFKWVGFYRKTRSE